MTAYRVVLRADVTAEWVGEADSIKEAERFALNEIDSLGYDVDFITESVYGPDEDTA